MEILLDLYWQNVHIYFVKIEFYLVDLGFFKRKLWVASTEVLNTKREDYWNNLKFTYRSKFPVPVLTTVGGWPQMDKTRSDGFSFPLCDDVFTRSCKISKGYMGRKGHLSQWPARVISLFSFLIYLFIYFSCCIFLIVVWMYAEVLSTKITPLKEKVEVVEGDAMEEWLISWTCHVDFILETSISGWTQFFHVFDVPAIRLF